MYKCEPTVLVCMLKFSARHDRSPGAPAVHLHVGTSHSQRRVRSRTLGNSSRASVHRPLPAIASFPSLCNFSRLRD